MAARKTPAERALADIEKAIKASTTAAEKADVAQRKADELTEIANRAEREVVWMAHHPDVPQGFDLDEFRRSLEAPFDEPDITSEQEEAFDGIVAIGQELDDVEPSPLNSSENIPADLGNAEIPAQEPRDALDDDPWTEDED